jgi:hypothetical protein
MRRVDDRQTKPVPHSGAAPDTSALGMAVRRRKAEKSLPDEAYASFSNFVPDPPEQVAPSPA